MKRKPISQAEARALRRRVEELESRENDRRRAWASAWPGGVHLSGVRMAEGTSAVREVITARKLGHAVIVLPDERANTLNLYALPLPGDQP